MYMLTYTLLEYPRRFHHPVSAWRATPSMSCATSMAVTVGRTRIRHDWKCASAPGRDDTVAFEDLRNQAKEAFSLGEYEAAHNLYASAAKAIVAVDTDPAAAL